MSLKVAMLDRHILHHIPTGRHSHGHLDRSSHSRRIWIRNTSDDYCPQHDIFLVLGFLHSAFFAGVAIFRNVEEEVENELRRSFSSTNNKLPQAISLI